jgi:N-acetylornithine carbamoyltransferase
MGKASDRTDLKGRHFVSTQDWKKEELEHVLALAASLKKDPINKNLADRTLFMVFFDPSLRTRCSFETAMSESGGHAVNLTVGQGMWKLEHREGAVMDGQFTEHVKDAARVLSRYGAGIAVRCFPELKNLDEDRKDLVINGFAKYATVPVINMESALHHPCQALADIMTIKEHLGEPKRKKFVLAWCYHPKPLPMAVPDSAALIASMFGMDVTVACPKQFELDQGIAETISNNCESGGGTFRVVNDLDESLHDAKVVYAKSWGSIQYYGRWEEEKKLREGMRDWKITEERMKLTGKAKLMHCLPVRRNVEVDDAVLDGPDSLIYDEAENRTHVQKALLNCIMR